MSIPHSLDARTSELVDTVIRDRLSGCTIIAGAHDLSSIREFDRVAVLDEGRLVEFDEPRVLLAREQSYFGRLVEASGLREVGGGGGGDACPEKVAEGV